MRVIEGKKKKSLKSGRDDYHAALERLSARINQGEKISCACEKMIFLFMKYLSAYTDFNGMEYGDLQDLLSDYFAVTDAMSFLTPKQFMRLFPVEKTYDGKRWQMKDYFTCMEAVGRYAPNKPIGADKIQEFLMDYWNPNITRFEVGKMLCASAVRRSAGGKGIMEEFAEDQGIPTYTFYKDENIMVNNSTGELSKVRKAKKRRPRWLKVVGK